MKGIYSETRREIFPTKEERWQLIWSHSGNPGVLKTPPNASHEIRKTSREGGGKKT